MKVCQMKIIFTAQKLLTAEELKEKQKAWFKTATHPVSGKRMCLRVLTSNLELKNIELNGARCVRDRGHDKAELCGD